MAYANDLDPTTPAATESVRQGDDRIRELKAALIERIESFFADADGDPLHVKTGATFDGTASFAGIVDIVAGILALNGVHILVAPAANDYVELKDNEARGGLLIGNTNDPNNYYDNTGHLFRDRAGPIGAALATLNAEGLIVQGPSSGAGPVFALGGRTATDVGFRKGSVGANAAVDAVLGDASAYAALRAIALEVLSNVITPAIVLNGQNVTLGAADSGGAGYKVLRVPN